ncbi:MAG: hypothetical protein E7E19_00845 [Varibaculum cambriense]|nr:hypothetical protein [Varibaculum cambriense]
MSDTPTNPFPAVSPSPYNSSGMSGGAASYPYSPQPAVSPPPASFYPVNSPYPGSPTPTPPPPESKNSTPIIFGVVAGILVVVLVALGFIIWYISKDKGAEAQPSQSASSQVTTTETNTVIEREDSSRPAPRVTTRGSWSAPAGISVCPGSSGVVMVNGVTSCEFASNVANDYYSTNFAGTLYDVYSPATGYSYDMSCSYVGTDSSGNSWALCTGGNNAQVYIRR